eukprot:TRINITY_DN10068_c0_g1_i1.p1 TRINITY_DN10068_c0_g1~~TRINITY_DN10068_c0_g1_i1.p1  ORF type:complete len:157 (-),score=22.04 TRINITY_DN10068_c0_g1_i1:85-555(-)
MLGDSAKPGPRETILSYLSGCFFAAAWWIWIDAVAVASTTFDPIMPNFGHWVPGIISSVGLLMVNSVSWTDLEGFGFGGGDEVQSRARIWLFISFAFCFGGIIASIWIGVVNWFTNPTTEPHSTWPGAAIILQNSAIFVSGLLYRFAKPIKSEHAF